MLGVCTYTGKDFLLKGQFVLLSCLKRLDFQDNKSSFISSLLSSFLITQGFLLALVRQ